MESNLIFKTLRITEKYQDPEEMEVQDTKLKREKKLVDINANQKTKIFLSLAVFMVRTPAKPSNLAPTTQRKT